MQTDGVNIIKKDQAKPKEYKKKNDVIMNVGMFVKIETTNDVLFWI